MAAPRVGLWILLLLAALGAGDLAAQAAPSGADGLGTAVGCTRSRMRIEGSVEPVTAASHTFLGRFVRAAARWVPASLPRSRGLVELGVGGDAPIAVTFSLKRPVSYALLPAQTQDRLAPEQHRALYTALATALAEVGTPASGHAITLRFEGTC